MVNEDIEKKVKDMNDGRRNKSPNREKIGIVIICIGKKGTGKSTTIREVLRGVKTVNPEKEFYICDPNREFLEFDSSFDPDIDNAFNIYIDTIKHAKRSVIFVEEATIFLDPRKREGILVDKMVKARHDENIIIMNFHSWRSVPLYIFDMIDYLYLHKTNDTESKVKNKCDIPFVMDSFRNVNNKNKSKYYKELIDFHK